KRSVCFSCFLVKTFIIPITILLDTSTMLTKNPKTKNADFVVYDSSVHLVSRPCVISGTSHRMNSIYGSSTFITPGLNSVLPNQHSRRKRMVKSFWLFSYMDESAMQITSFQRLSKIVNTESIGSKRLTKLTGLLLIYLSGLLQSVLFCANVLQSLTPNVFRSDSTESFHLVLGLPGRRFPSGFVRSSFRGTRSSSIRCTWPSHLSRLILMYLTISGSL